VHTIDRLGALSLTFVPDHGGYGTSLLKQHAEALDRPYSFLSLARRFADRYDAKELKQLCQTPIGVSHMRALVDVENKRQRGNARRCTPVQVKQPLAGKCGTARPEGFNAYLPGRFTSVAAMFTGTESAVILLSSGSDNSSDGFPACRTPPSHTGPRVVW
jgi:hypothetical protein